MNGVLHAQQRYLARVHNERVQLGLQVFEFPDGLRDYALEECREWPPARPPLRDVSRAPRWWRWLQRQANREA